MLSSDKQCYSFGAKYGIDFTSLLHFVSFFLLSYSRFSLCANSACSIVFVYNYNFLNVFTFGEQLCIS
jgi:hypothetical protein